ncbi:DUF6090 family protein [Winogradskyella sp. PG-2]|uniref:DUF6090 family protein n=1 Tax=Winogradskyella sp. PG-2 TaxID=754409 RepID=UPI0004588C8C|nr:DUF6090 family protein [Winogradskyella sp. PG-2]BAO77268.1 hypothetical protein WPG_3038 [Winogradskyella sp. PG-2]
MIKFFRNIRQNLLSKGKTGKYFKYAIGEIILVVIGILIALQINNWNQNRIERKKESNYIENINKEFKLNRAQLDSVTFYHYKVYINATKILNLMPIDINTINKDSLSIYISETFNHYTFNPQQSSVNSLTNTSTFETISNLELRRLLQKWDELVKDYKEEELLFRNYSFDNFIPYISKHISLKAFTNKTNILDHNNVTYTFLNSLEFENAIALRKGLMSDVILGSELKEVHETIDRIIVLTTTK